MVTRVMELVSDCVHPTRSSLIMSSNVAAHTLVLPLNVVVLVLIITVGVFALLQVLSLELRAIHTHMSIGTTPSVCFMYMLIVARTSLMDP